MFYRIREDIKVIFDRDPAARSTLEVLFCYPGLHAVMLYRVAHKLWNSHYFFLGRFISHFARWLTGIEIHPAAKIGKGFFIDHGMGVVVGETAEVGDNVMLYHQVTLGGTSLHKVKRHPTLCNNVIVGAGAKVLGNITIGENSKVGSGSVVVNDVPPNSVVVGVPGKVVRKDVPLTDKNIDVDFQNLPDPMVKAITCLLEMVTQSEENLTKKTDEIEQEFKRLKCKHDEQEQKLINISEHKKKKLNKAS
ncbi:MAG: serine O-acetyltransferase [Nitrospinae bacterium]|nr:serine O-acetyltransferase [Nitrospinota bacterium]